MPNSDISLYIENDGGTSHIICQDRAILIFDAIMAIKYDERGII